MGPIGQCDLISSFLSKEIAFLKIGIGWDLQRAQKKTKGKKKQKEKKQKEHMTTYERL